MTFKILNKRKSAGTPTTAIKMACNQLIAARWQLGHLTFQSRNTIPQLWQYQIILAIATSLSDQYGKLLVRKAVASLQIDSRLVHQPKIGVGPICVPKTLERDLINHYRSKEQHRSVECPRLHRIAVAAKQRHAKRSLIIKSEPIAIGAPHGVHIAGGLVCLSVYQRTAPWSFGLGRKSSVLGRRRGDMYLIISVVTQKNRKDKEAGDARGQRSRDR